MKAPYEIELGPQDLVTFYWVCSECEAGEAFNWGAPSVAENIFLHLRANQTHRITVSKDVPR